MQVFKCQHCQKPFQARPEFSGKKVKCPSCAQPNLIPELTKEKPIESASKSNLVFACPSCSGQFQVPSEMDQQTVACPHCQSPVLVQAPSSEQESVPKIKTKIGSKSKKKSASKRGLSFQPPSDDMFAPGFAGASKSPSVPPAKPSTATPIPTSSSSSNKTPTEAPAAEPKSEKLESDRTRSKPIADDSTAARSKASEEKSAPSQESDSSKPIVPASNKEKRLAVPPTTPAKPRNEPRKPVETRGKDLDSEAERALAAKSKSSIDSEVSATPSASKKSETSDRTEPSKDLGTDKKQPASHPVSQDASQESKSATADVAEVVVVAAEKSLADIAHLLPPRFEVDDPTRLAVTRGRDDNKILLPDADGGTKRVDKRIVRIDHHGEKVSLVVLSPEQREQRRLIQNLIVILIGVLLIAATIWMLVN